MSSTIINGKEIGQEIRKSVAVRVEALRAKGVTPGLAVILVGDNPASQTYVANKQKSCAAIGVYSESDLKMASVQTIAKVRQQVENAVITKAVAEPVKDAFADQSFIREILSTVVKSFNASNPESACLDVILPEKVRKELGEKAASRIIAELGNGLEVSFSKKFESGFKIGPKEGGYQISFSGEDFAEMFSEYLRPAARKILFG